MATNANHASGRNTNRKATGKKKGNQTLKIVIFLIEILIIIAMLIVVWKVWDTTDENPGYNIVEIDKGDVHINPSIEQAGKESQENETKPSTGQEVEVENPPKVLEYWNIALFGLDASKNNNLQKGQRSDSIIIASIHKETGEIKLVSVYRDTYLNIGNDSYQKCNSAYSLGGYPSAISMLNMNMDLNIEDFVSVSYRALIDCIDALGGVYIDVDKAELEYIDQYQVSILANLDGIISESEFQNANMSKYKGKYEPVKKSGYQLLNGLQAAAYCRIRYTAGDDFKRAERQREVIAAMFEQAQSADLDTLLNVVKKVAPNVLTTFDVFDVEEMGELLKNINNYKIVDEAGFPNEDLRTTGNIGGAGSCVIPVNLEENVIWLHEFLFEEEDYQVTDEVKECSEMIEKKTSKYFNKVSD